MRSSGKTDFNLGKANQLAISYNFDYSKNTNQTFDVAYLWHFS